MAEEDPNSILDTDLYKLTMHYAVWKTNPSLNVRYGFINRSSCTQKFTAEFFDRFKQKVKKLETRVLKREEKEWLSLNCSYLSSEYLDYLETFRFEPSKHLRLEFQLTDRSNGLGDLVISVEGHWKDTILYEVPLLSMISESYFETIDRDWSYEDQTKRAMSKANRLLECGCKFSEFGTRRRRSWKTQLMVVEAIRNAAQSSDLVSMISTSNVWMAYRFGLRPVGTIAHEYMMAEGALNGYKAVNIRAMSSWERSFPNHPELLIALCDTFSSKVFFKELIEDPERAKRWTGLRQDSGDPKEFVLLAKEAYKKIGVDLKTKLIVFSDGLDVETCVELKEFCRKQQVVCTFGIGTNLTNDFDKISNKGDAGKAVCKSKPLNIVIKLLEVNGNPCVKISDELSKATGPKETIEQIKKNFLTL
ncbi:nicotinate phosphoribosyltransferase [Phakopsora pachyrhizi]|uniref:Nicotinate phosphoribosyltransferase n=1 Tax=Phakopsora pachyrhizi TaxID=170000 RepID=A0AAV0ASG2_PHAPC|nr:nicotinate phosphoribosyltransferase [Phakopsora pachyrhizi]CAH7671582.1 nicotinate phosphoribosyltransferase [Phakopsora pachyrhizi]